MRSVRAMRFVAVTACVCLLGAGAAGCSTTQEKAAAQAAKAEHILKARAERQAKRHHDKQEGKKR